MVWLKSAEGGHSQTLQVMSRFPEICESRKKEFYQVFTLITAKDNARERRRRCFNYFSTHMSEGNNFEAGLVYEVSHELLVLVDEFRELLDRLFSWCDLCLPAQEQAFAESHRLKIQKFQVRGGICTSQNPSETKERSAIRFK
jgi:hypothetical protein